MATGTDKLVTVFGGSGFIGSQVVRALARNKGVRIRVAVRNVGRGYKLRMLGDVGQIEVVQANIRNPASIALHQKLGFERIGTMRRVGEKFGRILDVEMMQLHLDRRP